MASKARKGSNPTASVPFEKFVTEHKLNLPLLVRVTHSEDPDIATGNILRLKHVQEIYEIQYDDPISHHKVRVEVPPDFGGLRTVSQYPPDHVYKSVQEMAFDFPPSVRVLENVKIQGTVVKCGEGLKLVRTQTIGKEKYLICLHYPSDKPFQVPFRLRGKFRRRDDDAIHTAEQLKDRMPILVQRERNIGHAMRHSNDQMFKVFPADFEGIMSLTMSGRVQVEHWHLSNPVKVFNGTDKRDIILKLNCGISVAPADDLEKQFGPVENVIDVAKRSKQGKPTFAMVCSNHSLLKPLGINSSGVVVAIYGSERKQGVVVGGSKSNIVVPKNYNKTILFKTRENTYPTPYDLWTSKHTGEVTAMQTAMSPDGFQDFARSIYKMDRFILAEKIDNGELSRLAHVVNDVEEELELIHLTRTFSEVNACLGKIRVDSNAEVNFKEPPKVVGSHSLSDILQLGTLPMDIALCDESTTESEDVMCLIQESPLTILEECAYSVAYVTVFDTSRGVSMPATQVLEIPDFMEMQVRQAQELPGCKKAVVKKYQKPNSGLYKLSSEEYYRLMGVPMNESAYAEILPPLKPKPPPQFVSNTTPPSKSTASRVASSPLPTTSPSRKPPKTLPKPDRRVSAPPRSPRQSSDTLYQNGHIGVRPKPRPRQGLKKRALSDPGYQELTGRRLHPSGQGHAYTKSTTSKDYQVPFEISVSNILVVPPPADGVITEFDVMQTAGLMRHLGFSDHAVLNCINEQINGQKLCDIFRSTTAQEICKVLKVDKLSEVISLQHFAEKSEMAKSIPKVNPPEDEDISNFSVSELAGLMRHLGLKEGTVSICLAKQIDGMKLCMMDKKQIKTELNHETSDANFYALQHFITQSRSSRNIPDM